METFQKDLPPAPPALGACARGFVRTKRMAGAVLRFLLNPRKRSENMARLRYGTELFQAATHSQADRYPELFQECSRRLASILRPRVLSFGCSTGEEIASLAQYMPNAEMFGVDINPWCLRQCGARPYQVKVRLMHRFSREFLQLGELDAIFCMAVFQRFEHRTEGWDPGKSGFTFERFEAEVLLLDSKLRVGGLFFLDESDFSFQMTTAAARYEPLEFDLNRVIRERPLFDSANRLVARSSLFTRAFIKKA
jgi:hypothetical protein